MRIVPAWILGQRACWVALVDWRRVTEFIRNARFPQVRCLHHVRVRGDDDLVRPAAPLGDFVVQRVNCHGSLRSLKWSANSTAYVRVAASAADSGLLQF